MQSRNLARTTIAAAVLAALVGGYMLRDQTHFRFTEPATAAELPIEHHVSANIAQATDFSGIVERYGPAVVNISVTGKAQKTGGIQMGPNVDPDDPLFQFFKRFGPQFGPQFPQQGPEGQVIPHGEGSGFIVTPDGLILTNAHVVDGAQEVVVKLTDRREFKAKVLGADKQSDVAVIKIDAKSLPTVVLGDPNLTKVGEPVLAIGSPFGFENSATAGIVSAKARSLPDDPYVAFMQTDVAVNPGNSGGPLFNLKGEVIGINSQIYTHTGGYQGLSFAIPIDVANKVQSQLVLHGKVTRGRLGVTVQEMNQVLADSFGLKKTEGALVSAVEKGSPADKAGLQAGDVILRLNDHEVEHSSDLSSQVSDLAPGSSATLGIVRKGNPMSLNVKIGEAENASVAQNDNGAASKGRLGVLVRPLKPGESDDAAGGLVVERASGPAARAGIEPGDVILALNGTPITSGQQFQSLVQHAGHSVALLIQRNDAKIFVPVELG